MKVKTRASRVATAGSRNIDLAVDTEILASATPNFQAAIIAHRYRLSPAVAAVTASLLYPPRDHWSVGQ